jgi:hypothetical protein
MSPTVPVNGTQLLASDGQVALEQGPSLYSSPSARVKWVGVYLQTRSRVLKALPPLSRASLSQAAMAHAIAVVLCHRTGCNGEYTEKLHHVRVDHSCFLGLHTRRPSHIGDQCIIIILAWDWCPSQTSYLEVSLSVLIERGHS